MSSATLERHQVWVYLAMVALGLTVRAVIAPRRGSGRRTGLASTSGAAVGDMCDLAPGRSASGLGRPQVCQRSLMWQLRRLAGQIVYVWIIPRKVFPADA